MIKVERDPSQSPVKSEKCSSEPSSSLRSSFEQKQDTIAFAETASEKEGEEVYFMCSICRHWSYTRSSLIIHTIEHFHERPTCEVCGDTFTQAQDYADHCAEHVGWSCIACDQTFFQKEDFELHLLEHKLECAVCKVIFPSEEILQEHYLDHTEMINLQCEICHKYISSKKGLAIHMTRQHGGPNQSFKCKECNETFTQVASLRSHVQNVHDNIRDYACHLCGREYACRESLETHLLNHAGEKPYTCLVCGRSFAGRKHFRKHGLEHIPSVEPLACELCGRTFTTQTQLRSHRWFHDHVKAYKCHVCTRSFNYSSHLKRHLGTHSGERAEICGICAKAYSARADLKRHLRKVHEMTPTEVERFILNGKPRVRGERIKI